jgi:hypothetical protein
MVADSVEIVTCHPDDEHARHLTLRSVHGKYLIRMLPKSHPEIRKIGQHGTVFRLHIRASVRTPDVLGAARQWIVIPGCRVSVNIDGNPPEQIGYSSPADALLALLKERDIEADIGPDNSPPKEGQLSKRVRIRERSAEGVTLAYAVSWDNHFREWAFVSGELTSQGEEAERRPLGTCIEGIRVEVNSPGFAAMPVAALANVVGPKAPRTNVARSGLEATAERDGMLSVIYGLYRDHVADELRELQHSRSFSLTWATGEARYLLGPLAFQSRTLPVNRSLFELSLKDLSVLAVEKGSERRSISPSELDSEPEFWTIDCELFRSAELLIREAATSASLSGITGALNLRNFDFPSSLVLCGVRPSDDFGQHAFRNREVDRIILETEQRRVDLRWVTRTDPRRWLSLSDPQYHGSHSRLYEILSRRGPRHRSLLSTFSGIVPIGLVGVTNESAIRALDKFYILPSTPQAEFLSEAATRIKANDRNAMIMLAFLFELTTDAYSYRSAIQDPEHFVQERRSIWENGLNSRDVFRGSFLSEWMRMVERANWNYFDPSVWIRGSEEEDYEVDFPY